MPKPSGSGGGCRLSETRDRVLSGALRVFPGCECLDPKLDCKFGTQCVIYERARERKKKEMES